MLNSLERFIAGSDITVTYYHQQIATTNDLSNDGDNVESLDPVHSNILRIENFQFKLQEAMDFQYNEEDNVSSYRGIGLCYSGFTPMVGDWFLYEIEKGVLGKFVIDGTPTRLSIDSHTCHTMPFMLVGFPDENEIKEYERRVRKVAWFDLQTFLLGNATLLTSEVYEFVINAEYQIQILLEYYHRKFYDRYEYKSYLRPDVVYDPYVVDFMNSIVSYDNLYNVPQQLVTNMKYGNYSLWAKLKNPDIVPWHLLKVLHVRKRRTYTNNSVGINCLLNRDYVELVDSHGLDTVDGVPQLFDNFTYTTYNGSGNFDKLVYGYLNSKSIHTPILTLEVENVMNLSEMDQFYHIPILIFLLKESVSIIREGSGRTTATLEDNLPTTTEFNQDDLVNGKLTLTANSKIVVIDMETSTGVVTVAPYVYYTLQGVVIDINRYCSDNEVEIDTDTWKVRTNIPITIRREQ